MSASTAPLIANLCQCAGGVRAYARVGVFQRRRDRRCRARVAELSQCAHGLLPHLDVGVLERVDQCRDGARVAELAERMCRLSADAGVAILQRTISPSTAASSPAARSASRNCAR